MNKSATISILIIFCSSIASAHPVGDLNEDWKVDFSDLELFAAQWFDTPDCLGSPGCADLVGNNRVNLHDLALLAENWLIEAIPPIVINEFMASNDTTVEDPDEPGEYPDWIEIYNYGTSRVEMGGMQIADNNKKYVIPSGVGIDASQYLVFWADDDAESVPDQGPLHTNFKLSADGDEVRLYTNDNRLIDAKSYSQTQAADHSFGRFPDNDHIFYTMDSPTPGSANTAGMSGKVWFSKLSGTFTSNFALELSTESATAHIRYTTNGSIPTASSNLYSGPITIDKSQARRIRARAYDSPLAPGPIQSHYYIPLAADIQNFSSNLPIIIIDSFGENIDNNGSYNNCWNFDYLHHQVASVFIETDKDTGVASTTDIPDFAGRAGARIRGESSRCWDKRQYSLEIWDDNDKDMNASLLGFASESDWVLNAPYGDKTLIRNVIAYKWANDISEGFAAPGTRLVEVFFNQTNGNTSYADYRGVYVLMEKIKVSDNRVDIGSLNSGDTAEPDISGGYLLRVDKDNGQERFWTSANMIGGIQYYDPDETGLIGTQKTWIQNWINQFEADLNASDFDNPIDGYAKYIDIESFIEYDIIAEIFKNSDGFKLSTYFYKERNGKLHFGPHWDYNFSAGNTENPIAMGQNWGYPEFFPKASTSEEWFCDQPEFEVYGWHRRLLQDHEYMLRYADKWFEHREDKLSDSQINTDIDYYYNMLDPDGPLVDSDSTPADRNFAKWDILNTVWFCNYYYGGNPAQNGGISHTYNMETEWLKNWFNGQGDPAPGESYSPVYDELSDRLGNLDSLWLSDRNIEAPPTLLIDGLLINIGGSIPAGANLTMTGSAGTIYYTTDGSDPRIWTHWDTGGTTPFTTMLVTENASKKVLVPTGAVDNDWKGGNSFNDSGWNDYNYVADRNGAVGFEASAGYEDYLSYDMIDTMYNNHPTCYIRTSFSVDADELAEMDYMTLRVRFDDAFVAYINGTEVARSSLAPALPEWNSQSTTYLAGDSIAFTAYDITVDLGLLNPGSGNILAVHGLNSSSGSSDFLISFELEAGEIGSGDGLIQGGAVSSTATAYSDGIILDSTKKIKARIKNGSNWSALNEAVFAMDNVISSLRITEIMYHPEDPNDEYIELKNTGGTDIDIILCELTKGVDFTFPSVVLAPDEYVVVARNIDEFNSRYPAFSGNLAGEYTGDVLDDGGESIQLKDAAGNIIHEFEYEDNWHPVTDGKGFSLNIIDPTDANLNNWNRRLSWQASNVKHGTPGQDHIANAVDNDAIVINEVLTHTDELVYGDWVELYNASGVPVDIGNWYLSDDIDNLKKYRIAAGTNIPSYGYLVLTSTSNFRNPADSGSSVQFGLSELGESVYLSSGNGSDLSGGYSVVENFGAANNDVTLGRYTKGTPTYNTDFTQMASQTRGYVNPQAPYVPDVVITEIMYNAKNIEDLLGEYIELYNRGGSAINLYDVSNPSNTWKFTKGIDFAFPTGVSIDPGERIIISRANPAAFKTANGVSGTRVFGPFENDTEMSNDGEKIELSMPGPPESETGFVPYIRLEQVNYSDGIHPFNDDPWPTGADGRGDSLHRNSASNYSNDVGNWSAASPTPGS